MVGVILVFFLSVIHAQTLAGYTSSTNVTEHSEIDLDQRAIETALSSDNFSAAYTSYSVGGNSVKGSGAIRTIQGFSTGAFPKMVTGNNSRFVTFANYWGAKRNSDNSPQYDYADKFTGLACQGVATGMFTGADTETLKQFCKKGSVYQNIWMYVIWEMQDAVNDCLSGDITNNGGAAVAWDEAWAFYTGSLEGVDGSSKGYLLHALAEKRCPQFGTCSTTVTTSGASQTTTIKSDAKVNAELLTLFQTGQSQILAGQCTALQSTMDMIATKMVIPLIQGALRYVYRSDPNGPLQSSTTKDRAEGWAFTAAVLPLINQCNSTAANEIEENMIWNAPSALTDGYQFTKRQFESVYECLGISCKDVGGLLNENGTSYLPGMEPCISRLAGYRALTDVTEHSEIDLDQRAIETALSSDNFSAAYTSYSVGGNSVKGSGAIRTIQGFSTGAFPKMVTGNNSRFVTFANYWGAKRNSDNSPQYDYADKFTGLACQGVATGMFTGADTETLKQFCKKGSVYQNIWMYVIWEMQDAVNDCLSGDITNNGGAAVAWDEAWAFYTGSLEGVDGSSKGYLLHALAEKRCPQFGTCSTGISAPGQTDYDDQERC
eukprot:jgi/Bigna1/133615/aug1.22_g8323